MKDAVPTETTIRQYLLGRLDEQEKEEPTLSRQIYQDDELAEMVDAIADEIIGDYLDGTLSPADKKAVEEYFLRPPERKERLEFGRLLRDRLEKKPAKAEDGDIVTGRPIFSKASPPVWVTHWRSHFRTYCELTALVLIIFSSILYISSVRHRIESEQDASRNSQAKLENELAQEREHSANLARELAQLQPPVAVLAPFVGTLRDTAGHQVAIKPFTQRIQVEIAVEGASADAYDVRVETQTGTLIWSQPALKPSHGALRFEMPVQGITAGAYQIVLTSQATHSAKLYWFRAKVAK